MLGGKVMILLAKVLPAIIRERQNQRKMAKLSSSDGGSSITKEERVTIVKESLEAAFDAIVDDLD